MLTNEERRRLEELSRRMNEPSLTPKSPPNLATSWRSTWERRVGPISPRSYGHEAEAVASTAILGASGDDKAFLAMRNSF